MLDRKLWFQVDGDRHFRWCWSAPWVPQCAYKMSSRNVFVRPMTIRDNQTPVPGVYSYTKVSLILMSLQYSQETWISWAKPLLFGPISIFIVLHTLKTVPFIFYVFCSVSFVNIKKFKGKLLMRAEKTIKKFDQVKVVLPMKFIPLGCIMVTLRSETLLYINTS